ncbi:hypothetical protein MKQ70_05265 [Chitinophaga sedimenti]|uniref:hypothetical protein n=1 Tax=Chitinophaga sedimenti TaxID=2033606 RepID=UPI0020057718|nr:hypothetical protein [Chitinophaga sedimenti]MCK7554444.1 hypothetical protein [Chitinophaga sedimenti]
MPGIGTETTHGYKLAVAGTMIAEKVKVKTVANWPDYVFADAYQLPSLGDVAKYIREHQRLPEMPSAEEVKQEGIELAEMDKKLLQKIEELTLYVIKLGEENQQLKKEMEEIKATR